MTVVRVGVAFDDVTLAESPTWTYLTDTDSLVASFTIDRGRSFELDQTDVGRALVQINDRDGVLDPSNLSGPYYGSIEPLLQIKLDVLNPVTATYSTLYRGFIEDFSYDWDPSQRVNRLALSCVDAFAILAAIEMQPDGSFGDAGGPVGNIFFDNADFQTRIDQVLGNAGWPALLAVTFTGNVQMQESVYAPGDTALDVIMDALNAEFPGVSNGYVDKTGRVVSHGRLARFDPEGVSAGASAGAWDWQHWKAGDGAAVAASLADTAQIREFASERGISKLINYAQASPMGIAGADVAGQVVSDSVSIGKYGYRTWSKEYLLVDSGTTTGNTANDECKLYAQYYVDNYATPRQRISSISFKSMRPDDERAAANWDLLGGADISDQIDVTITAPGGGGFDGEPCFIEGIHYDVSPGGPDFAIVTMNLDLSPRAAYSSFGGTTYFPS